MLAQYRVTLTKEEVHKIKAYGPTGAKNAKLVRYARPSYCLTKTVTPISTGILN